jgi:hypothetical protein
MARGSARELRLATDVGSARLSADAPLAGYRRSTVVSKNPPEFSTPRKMRLADTHDDPIWAPASDPDARWLSPPPV